MIVCLIVLHLLRPAARPILPSVTALATFLIRLVSLFCFVPFDYKNRPIRPKNMFFLSKNVFFSIPRIDKSSGQKPHLYSSDRGPCAKPAFAAFSACMFRACCALKLISSEVQAHSVRAVVAEVALPTLARSNTNQMAGTISAFNRLHCPYHHHHRHSPRRHHHYYHPARPHRCTNTKHVG